MIVYKEIHEADLNETFLDGFERYQETNRVLYMDDGVLREKEDHFLESWDKKKLIQVTYQLRDCMIRGGKVFGAIHDNKVVGFACIESEIFNDGYVNMPYIHVSRDYRNMGIGKKMFHLIMQSGKEMGANKIYISAHPNVETQKFYQKMGCVPAIKINQRLFEIEPLDIQLEKEL